MLESFVKISATSEPPSLVKTPGKTPELASFRKPSVEPAAAMPGAPISVPQSAVNSSGASA
jgi:hypothetical protein